MRPRRTRARAARPYQPPEVGIHAPQPFHPPSAMLLLRAPTPQVTPGPVAHSPDRNLNHPSTSTSTAITPPADPWALALDFSLALVEEEQLAPRRFDPESCYYADWYDSANPLAFDAFKAAHGLVEVQV